MTSSQKLENFFAQFKTLHYGKGEMILRGGDSPQGVYFIKKGYVKDYAISKEGEELTFIIFKPGDFFPMQWAMLDKENAHYFEAMGQVEAWRASRDEFVNFIKSNPDVFFELTNQIVIRLGGILERMEYLAFGNAHERVASILAICAERFGEKQGRGITIKVRLTHKDIANLLGITRETASIELKKLERKSIIAYQRRLLIVKNKKRLEQESLLPRV